jgi:hypothetical protein
MRATDLPSNWEKEIDRLRRGLHLISDEHLDFRVRPGAMAVGEMVCHIATGEWFRFVARASQLHRRGPGSHRDHALGPQAYPIGEIVWMIIAQELHHRGQLFQMIAMQGFTPPDA